MSLDAQPVRVCEAPGCGTPLVRKRRGERMESDHDFAHRRFCGRACVHASLRGHQHPNPWRHTRAVVPGGTLPRVLPPRDLAAPDAGRDTRSAATFANELLAEATRNLARHPERRSCYDRP